MIEQPVDKGMAKPFVKWAGGKGSLIKELTSHLPKDFDKQENVTYVEPFVGGGAMLFYMLSNYSNITHAIINDVNDDLITCYRLVKTSPRKLISLLKKISDEFFSLETVEEKSTFYYDMRDKYNNEGFSSKERRAACFIFLNKTCFNGLYRVNTKGKFNVPFGRQLKPLIYDENIIMRDHKLLQKVHICKGNYSNVKKHLTNGYHFIYLDPPYRPLSGSSCFIEYTHNTFDDTQQELLKGFCDDLTKKGYDVMISNSNSKDEGEEEPYFSKLYNTYQINQILAHRFINAHVGKREKEIELLITNYKK